MELDFERVKKYEKWVWLATCFILVFVMYGQTIFGDFVFDDRNIVEHQAILSDPNQLHKTLSLPFWSQESGLYRPITLLSYTFNYIVFGVSPWGFHLVNLLLYALVGWLIWLVFKRLFGSQILAGLTAVLFLILPIHTEVVANISGRSEILALLFSLLVFWELAKDKINFWRPGLWFLLAIGSKETAIAAVPIGMIIVWIKNNPNFVIPGLPAPPWRWTRNPKTWIPAFARLAASLAESRRGAMAKRAGMTKKRDAFLISLLSILVGALIYFGARFLVLGQQAFLRAQTTIVENPLQFAAAKERLATAFKVLTMYLQKTFWPTNLCSDYSFNQIPVLQSFFNWPAVLGTTVIIILIIGVFIGWKKSPAISFGCAWFLLSFFLVSNFILPIGTIAGERLMYFPSVGICLLLAWGVVRMRSVIASDQGERGNPIDGGNISGLLRRYAPRNDKLLGLVFFILLFCLIVFYGAISFQRAGDWLTEKKLFASAAKCAPNSVLSRSNLGAAYYLEGNLAEAKKALLEAQAIYPDYPKGVNNLGLVYWKEGDKAQARELFLKALSYRFPYYGAYENLALLAIEDKNWPEAKNWLLKFYSGNEPAAEAYLRAYRGW
ncbi:DUF1736 domain-containing protein [Patescibacteria group bacterium]|nr:DUF1736 domain-containing protein [Patescibacteria group bacterium]